MISFRLDGDTAQAKIGLLRKKQIKTWYNYHVTKHVVGDFKNEFFYKLVDISEEEAFILRNTQLNEYYCSLERDKLSRKYCDECDFVDSCWNTLKNVREAYKQVIVESLTNDHENPRHAHAENRRKRKRELVFINDVGVSTVLLVKKEKLHVVTSYRYGGINFFKLKEKYGYINDDDIFLNNAKNKWRRKFRRPEYSSVKECYPENWNPVEL
jgi:hypothetical protein